jgi:hypothetical protein
MLKAPTREMRVYANRNAKKIEVILLADGLPLGSILWTEEEATQHARAVIEAIELVRGAKPSLILPENTAGISVN